MVATTATTTFDIGVPIGRAIQIIRRNFFWLFLLGVVADLPLQVLSVARMDIRIAADAPVGSVEDWMLYATRVLVDYCFVYMFYAALTHATMAALNGRRVSVAACASAALRDVPALCGLGAIFAISFYGGLSLLIVPGLFVLTVWSMIVAVRTVERKPILATLARSAELTRDYRWQIFGITFGYLVVTYSANYFANYLTSVALSSASYDLYYAVYRIVSGAMFILTSTPIGVFSASLYFELRRIKEGIAPEQLAAVFD